MKTYEAKEMTDFEKIADFVRRQKNQLSNRCWLLATAGNSLEQVQASRNGLGFVFVTEDDDGQIRAVVCLTVRDLGKGFKEGERLASSWFAMFHDDDVTNHNVKYLTHLIDYLVEVEATKYNVKKAEILIADHLMPIVKKALEKSKVKAYEIKHVVDYEKKSGGKTKTTIYKLLINVGD